MIIYELPKSVEKKDIESIDLILIIREEDKYKVGNHFILNGNIKLILEQEDREYIKDSTTVYNILAETPKGERYFLKFADTNPELIPLEYFNQLSNELETGKKIIYISPDANKGSIVYGHLVDSD